VDTPSKAYLLSFPERVLRAALGLGAGTTREVAELVLPGAVRNSQLYRNLVEATLRFLIEQVGEAQGVYPSDDELPADFLARRTAGNAVDVLGLIAFRASPVWILAALSDLSGMGRQLIPEIADALKQHGLLEKDTEFSSVDQMLDGLERTSSRLAATFSTPPLDVAGLRQEWQALRHEARRLQPTLLPSPETVTTAWSELKVSAAQQQRTVFETSSVMAMSAVRAFPGRIRWLALSAGIGARRAGKIVVGAWLEHYRETLAELGQVGYVAYASRQFGPYLHAAAAQFSPEKPTLTANVVEKIRHVTRRRRTE
jgi:hypothetical protein